MQEFASGSILFRQRKLPLFWTGQNAQHIAENHASDPKGHPYLHVRIQQLAAKVELWQKRGSRRFTGQTFDRKSGHGIFIVVDIFPKFATIITAYKS